jgi:hypothetical protein
MGCGIILKYYELWANYRITVRIIVVFLVNPIMDNYGRTATNHPQLSGLLLGNV